MGNTARSEQWEVVVMRLIDADKETVKLQEMLNTLTDEGDKTAVQFALNIMNAALKVEIVRCKDCKHRQVNEHYGEEGYLSLKAMCDMDTGDPFELGRNAWDDDWFCKDGERKTDG